MKPAITVLVGTRPEAVKMAPLVRMLRQRGRYRVRLLSTGQHRELLAQALDAFGLEPDGNLNTMLPGQSLTALMGKLVERIGADLGAFPPALVLGHGDTATCYAAALASFYRGVPFAHVEAGLRTHRLDSPFPEEFHRQSVAKLASLHFAPNEEARANLLAEGVPGERVHVVGNTVHDAVAGMLGEAGKGDDVVITLHRRESAGQFAPLLRAIRQSALEHGSARFTFSMHPGVKKLAQAELGGLANLELAQPLPYPSFLRLLAGSRLVLTDSGGIQEEAALLGKRVLLARQHTERADGLKEGLTRLVGTEPANVLSALREGLAAPPLPPSRPPTGPRASQLIGRVLEQELA